MALHVTLTGLKNLPFRPLSPWWQFQSNDKGMQEHCIKKPPVVTYGLMIAIGIAVIVRGWLVDRDNTSVYQQQLHETLVHHLKSSSRTLQSTIQHMHAHVLTIAGSSSVRGIVRAVQGNGFDAGQNQTLDHWLTQATNDFENHLNAHQHYHQIQFNQLVAYPRSLVAASLISPRRTVVLEAGIVVVCLLLLYLVTRPGSAKEEK